MLWFIKVGRTKYIAKKERVYNRIWTITTPPNINEKDDNGDIAFILKPERERWRKKMYNVRMYIYKKRGAKIPY